MLVVIWQWFKQVDLDVIDGNGGGPGARLRNRQPNKRPSRGLHLARTGSDRPGICLAMPRSRSGET